MDRQINKIYHEDEGRYKLIQKSKVTSNGVYHRHEKREWLNCVQCGKRVNNNKFHFCFKCYRNWSRQQRSLVSQGNLR